MANVEVMLISKDGKNLASFYGKLFARSDNFLNESVLFCKRPDEFINISSGQLIPLSRSVVAVPLNSTLKVGVDLWNRDKELSSNHEIAKGTAEFLAQSSDTIENNVFGKYGEIKVKVTWS
ncbi:hypothetical protein L1049_013136 [Liquidambar formosana]|uniref:DUF6598 domain-containing protein n=1 Tax=Liquidambar formosana TaxID=63359 RepID=A0AAP0WU13_LIQFO